MDLSGYVPEGSSITAVFEFWSDLVKRDGGLPRHRDLDPLAIPSRVLPDLSLYERVDGNRLKCRLAGGRFVAALGYEPRGQYLDQRLQPESYPHRARLFFECLDERRPVFYRGVVVVDGRDHQSFRRILLPVLADEDEVPRLVFGAMELEPNSSMDADKTGRIGTVLKGDPVA
ncbi:PAS domain-containing protein [Thalassobaculum sp.]|uniref:PAS domain-containing protein n=1 Tax=Thalassobaculum sp. TaxID=2022740 RepID=UPI0032EB51A4